MAEGFARHYGAGRVEAHSAGMEPTRLNANAVAAMQEKGIDISHQRSKAFDEDLARRINVVVTVCGEAEQRCPVLPAEVTKLHWPLEDPTRARGAPEEVLQVFRRSRDEIERLVRDLLTKVAAPGRGS